MEYQPSALAWAALITVFSCGSSSVIAEEITPLCMISSNSGVFIIYKHSVRLYYLINFK